MKKGKRFLHRTSSQFVELDKNPDTGKIFVSRFKLGVNVGELRVTEAALGTPLRQVLHLLKSLRET